jgi:hypothetical protein
MFLQRMFLRRRRSVALWLFALSVVPTFGQTARAQAPEEARLRDLVQTVQARKLLLEDPVLGPLNLGVKVTGRVAILWGPVPSQELSFRAEQRLQTMFELAEVRNRLTIESDDNAAPNVPLAPNAPRMLPDALPPALPIAPRRPLLVPKGGVELAGIVPDVVTSRSSPAARHDFAGAAAGLPALHMPSLGSFTLPR